MQARKERNRYMTVLTFMLGYDDLPLSKKHVQQLSTYLPRTFMIELCIVLNTLNRHNEQAYLAGIIAKAAGRELQRQGNTASEDDVTRRLQAAFAASSGECVSCGQTLVKEGGHPLTWSADRMRSELGYMHPEQVSLCVCFIKNPEQARQALSQWFCKHR